MPDLQGPAPAHYSIAVLRLFREKKVIDFVKRFVRDEEGVTAIEYGLIASLIAVAIIGAVTLLGNNLGNKFNAVASKLT